MVKPRVFATIGLVSVLLAFPLGAQAQDETLDQLDRYLEPQQPPVSTPSSTPSGRSISPAAPPTAQPPLVLPSQPTEPVLLVLNSHWPGTLGRNNQHEQDGYFRDRYRFEGKSGQPVLINIIGSSDDRMRLDPYLKLLGPDGKLVAEDDNSGRDGQRGDARLRLVLPEDGTYTIVVSTAKPEDTGRYVVGLLEVL